MQKDLIGKQIVESSTTINSSIIGHLSRKKIVVEIALL